MTTENSPGTGEAGVRELIEKRVEAVRAKDLDALTSVYAPDAVSFDALNPLRYEGSAAGRERAAAWLDSYQGEIDYEVRDLRVTAGGGVAFCHYLYRVRGTLKGGAEVDMWVRATVCFRLAEGRWVVTHEHNSVPFDAETGRASLDLKP